MDTSFNFQAGFALVTGIQRIRPFTIESFGKGNGQLFFSDTLLSIKQIGVCDTAVLESVCQYFFGL